MNLVIRFSGIIIFVLVLFGNHCPVRGVPANTAADTIHFTARAEKWVDSVFYSLTPIQRIAQLIMVKAWSDGRTGDDDIVDIIKNHNIGGIAFQEGGPVRQAVMTSRFQAAARTPLMIAMDAKWGLGTRIDSTITYPRHLTIGAVTDNRLIYDMGADLARQMNRLGVHINLCPVIKSGTGTQRHVGENHSFGQDKPAFIEKAVSFMRGMQDNGVLAVTSLSLSGYRALPEGLHSLVNEGIGGVLTSWPDHQSVTYAGVYPVLPDLKEWLREEQGFRGLTFSGDLGGKDGFSSGQPAVQALLAGNDILLFPDDIEKTLIAMETALEHGILCQDIIDERIRRVLRAKYLLGLNRPPVVRIPDLYGDLNSPASQIILRNLTSASISLLENHDDLLPLQNLDILNIATVSVTNGDYTPFQKMLELYSPMKHFTVSKYSSLETFGRLISELDKYNLVIVSINDSDIRRSRQYGISPQTSWFIRQLAPRNNVVLTVFTSPWGLSFFDDLSGIEALVMAYEDSHLAQEYAAQLVFGAIPARGRLPVSPIARYPAGSGYDTRELKRLRYTIPEKAGLDSRKLAGIDKMVNEVIEQKAAPGAQVLVARRGMVVYHKSFGHHTYNAERSVTLNDLYDLASITKIAASVPAIMRLTEERSVDLYKPLGYYLPRLQETNKGGLIIKDVLTHQARLQSWIPFYYDVFRSLIPDEELFSRRISARYPYMLGDNMFMNRHYTYANGLFSDEPNDVFSRQVAGRMYMNNSFADSIYKRIDISPLRPFGRYFYSDLGYYYLKDIIESTSASTLDILTRDFLYRPLGAGRLTYLPLREFTPEEIVPTENDMIFRRQLVHGYVHDHGAAMIGGVGGHAGLFSNANDLAKLMQLFLQEGEYGGTRFFRPETIREFTSAPYSHNGNRRGIGFDRPERNSSPSPAARSASPASFGHSGFTGTIAWVDPEEELVYIFLSNRVHPDQFNTRLLQMNARTKIHQVIYDAIID